MKKTIVLLLFFLTCQTTFAQLTIDQNYNPPVKVKTYPDNDGTIIYIDEGHNNQHIRFRDYRSLRSILKSDGYQIRTVDKKFDKIILSEVKILLVANAKPDSITKNFKSLPTPDAFSKEEVEAIRQWVDEGGSLFLVADHMPLSGASSSMAEAFGFTVYNSFAMNSRTNGVIDFKTSDGTLTEDSPITKGRNKSENVSQIRTFAGHGFKIPDNATSVLRLTESQTIYLTKDMWDFKGATEEFSAEGLSQGAILTYGKGRVVYFGEATMFKARVFGKKKIGMNQKKAGENFQLLLNTIHWLDNKI